MNYRQCMTDFAHKVDAAFQIATDCAGLLARAGVPGFGGLVTVDVAVSNVEQFAYLVSLERVMGNEEGWRIHLPKSAESGLIRVSRVFGSGQNKSEVAFYVEGSITKDCLYYLEYLTRSEKHSAIWHEAMKITGEIPF